MKIPFQKHLLQLYFTLVSYSARAQWKGKQKIFCLSLQKTGTTSTGDFFEFFGYPVVRSDLAQLRNWNLYWYQDQFEKIFSDPVFKNHQVFEDAPFWAKDFYKILYQKFPDAVFILFTRKAENWFESLATHGKDGVLGDRRFHALNYEIPEALAENDFRIRDYREHYLKFYEDRNRSVTEFFQSKSGRFFHAELEDPEKWNNLAGFLNLPLPENFEIHSNRNSLT